MGLGKILRKNYPTNQIEALQILSNAGIPTKLLIRDLKNNVLCHLQLLWQKDISQKELRFGLKVILGKLNIQTDIEMAVLSIHKENKNIYGMQNEAVDILEPSDKILQDKLLKWKMIKKWNTKPTTNQWLKYDHIDPKCHSLTANWTPYNIIQEFDENNALVRTIEITMWTPKDIDMHIGKLDFGRNQTDVKIMQGKFINLTT